MILNSVTYKTHIMNNTCKCETLKINDATANVKTYSVTEK